jgi:hypothetical protein
VSNIITRVKAAQGLKFPPNQEVTMNADGSGGPVSINKQVGPPLPTAPIPAIMGKKVYDNYDKFSDYGHMALDAVGMVPAIGVVADGINAAWYGAEYLAGREDAGINAGISAAAMIPGVGMGATATKYGVKGWKALKPSNIKKNLMMDVSDVVKNKNLTGFKPNKLDIVVGGSSVVNSGIDISNTDYDKPKVQEEVSALESERKGDEAINDPMSSGKTKSWSKGYSDYKAGGGKGSLSDFKNESNSWWNSAAGQKYAKDKNIKHRIASPSKQRYMGGVASSNRQSLKSYKQ